MTLSARASTLLVAAALAVDASRTSPADAPRVVPVLYIPRDMSFTRADVEAVVSGIAREAEAMGVR